MPYDPERHGPRRVIGPGFHDRVYDVVKRVPPGHVTTYGDVAAQIGLRSAARQVGFALAAIPDERDDVPWHRVVNSQGRLSRRGDGEHSLEQERRLFEEGIEVGPGSRVREFASIRHRFRSKQSG